MTALLVLPPASASGTRIRMNFCVCLALLLHLLVGGMALSLSYNVSETPLAGEGARSIKTGLLLLGRVSLEVAGGAAPEAVFSSGQPSLAGTFREDSGMDADARQPQTMQGQEQPQPGKRDIPLGAKPEIDTMPVPASATPIAQQREKREALRERRADAVPVISQKPVAASESEEARSPAEAATEDSRLAPGESFIAMPGSGAEAEADASSADIAPFGKANGPSFKHFIKPEYPALARRQGIAGEVLLRVLIDADGKAVRVEVRESAHESLARSAREAVLRSTFHPLRRNGLPVPCWTLLPVIFTLER